ncbi:MAG TPA: copper resistance protein NlpE N-terminal domain-containing protein [Gemmatimonas sp.]|uniref:copper resistance protein NlpE N-terminal domain-containing protein n=1 Tax=Gemmatimonas sp. TaxID=1962908 RepID=UPI002ED95661
MIKTVMAPVVALTAALLTASLAACGGDTAEQGADSTAAKAGPAVTIASIAPATYNGTLPCADCSGLITTLSVWPDSVYRLRETYDGKNKTPNVRMGRWQFDGKTLTLQGDTGVVGRWAFVHGDTLRMLDQAGQPIASELPMHLLRTDAMDPVSESAVYVGSFVYWADAPTLRECASGKTIPVLMKGDYKVLEKAYTAAKLPVGSGQQVEVQARLVPRPADMEGTEPFVFEISKYIGPSINGNCR